MPPIPVHLDDPIVAQKAEGVTPQTHPPPTQPLPDAPATTTATTTTTSQTYPRARPGAAAMPAPTPYAPAQPTRTTQAVQHEPPPPMPGAVPVPFGQHAASASALPPPPKAGEVARAGVTQTSTTQMQMPAQMGMPPPAMNYAGTRGTATTTSMAGATTVNLGPVAPTSATSPAAPLPAAPLPAPPPEGYRQDSNAQEMNAAQRSSLEELQRRESVFANVHLGGGGGVGGGGGGGEGVGVGAQVGETAASAWSAVKGVFGTAGEKLAEVEGDVWRRINGGGK